MDNTEVTVLDTVISTDDSTDDSAVAQEPHSAAHTPAQEPAHLDARYTARAIADKYFVKDVTIRTRWFDWLLKVAPEHALKDEKGYTQLAADLFEDYAVAVNRDQMKREDWVQRAQDRFAERLAQVEEKVLEAELMDDFVPPKEVGGALSTLQNQTSALNQFLDAELAGIDRLIEEMGIATQELSDAELEQAKAAGAARGAHRFKAEVVAETATYAALRQKYANRVQQSPQPKEEA